MSPPMSVPPHAIFWLIAQHRHCTLPPPDRRRDSLLSGPCRVTSPLRSPASSTRSRATARHRLSQVCRQVPAGAAAAAATEVKELAKQTAAATEDIRRRIKGIQASTGLAVNSIGEITEVIKKVNEVSRTIASAVEEQSITTKEIAKNVAETSTAARDGGSWRGRVGLRHPGNRQEHHRRRRRGQADRSGRMPSPRRPAARSVT